MKHIFLVALTTILSTTLFGQNQIQIDFENDGKMDNANLKKTEEGYFIQYTLSTDGKKHTTKIITMGGQENKLTVKKNVLIINSQFMRGENYFKFRYDKKQQKIILIGYDNNQYGNASNDGSGSSSYNLITGNYEANWYSFDENKNELFLLPTISKKLPIKIYTMDNFSDKTIEEIDDIGYKLLPEKLK